DQVKVRGYRIELGEVETQLTDLEGVESALVMAAEIAGSQQLIGYVKSNIELDEVDVATYISELKTTLASQLPDYMVPNVLMVVEQWPLTNNGKVDKKALPQPDGSLLQGEYVAPETETEQALAEIWSELLEIDVIKLSTTANFFALGGHSLLVIRMFSIIKQKFDVNIDVSRLFDNPSVKGIAEKIDSESLKIKFSNVSDETLEGEVELLI
ncbi:phosphopantetheine-binding protein, partial [Pseudoalteromonas luteoviolacea]